MPENTTPGNLPSYLLSRSYCLGLLFFPLVLLFFFDIKPLERFPGWDLLWSDAIVSGKLSLLRTGLAHGEFLSISPYHGLGHNTAGDGPALTPFFSPFTALLPFASDQVIIQFRFVCYVYLGLAGVYLLLRRMHTEGPLACIGALLYIAIPVQFTNQQYYFTIGFYALPALVLATYCYAESNSAWHLFLISLLSFLTYSATDIFFLIITPVVVFIVAVFAAVYNSHAWEDRFLYIGKVCGVVLISGSFYIVPLYCNLHETTVAAKILKSFGLSVSAPVTSIGGFWDFFQYFGIPSFYMPQPSSAMVFYVPSFFIFYILLYLVIGSNERVDTHHRRIGLAIIVTACCMFALSFLYYSLPEKLLESGKGILRYHLNLWPFFVILAACLFVASPLRRSTQLRIILSATILALVLDFFLFCIKYPAPGLISPAADWFHAKHEARSAAGLTTPNLFSVRFLKDMWLTLPLLNLLVPALLIGLLATASIVNHWRRAIASNVVVMGVFIWCVLYMAIHNELRVTQESGWQEIGRSTYHLDAHNLRRTALETLVSIDDRRNHRLLPASADVFRINRGRNWKFCADTEMLSAAGLKLLFTYREMEHPFTALFYSKFYPQFGASNFFPPLSENIPKGIGAARMLGVRYVLSADTKIASTDLTLIGQIDTPNPPFNETAAGGPMFVYELEQFQGIASFYTQTIVLSQRDAIKRLIDWDGQSTLIYLSLEEELKTKLNPTVATNESTTAIAASVQIESETLNSAVIRVECQTAGFVNLAYLHRPFWKATVNGADASIYRSNGLMMSVIVPPGISVIHFNYSPWDVYGGYFLTAAALVALLLLALLGTIRQKMTRVVGSHSNA